MFFEAWDHKELVRESGAEFERLLQDADRGLFGHTFSTHILDPAG